MAQERYVTLTIRLTDEGSTDDVADGLADALKALASAGVIEDFDDNGWWYQ